MAMLSKDDILRGLRALDLKARKAGVLVDISIYEGASLSLVFNARPATRDVDAVVHGHPQFLRKAAAEIAEDEGWPTDWLNDGVKGFVSANEKMEMMALFGGSEEGGIRIHTPVPEYLFAMKCMAMRPEGVEGSHDISDIEMLADIIGINDADEALSIIEQYYPSSLIPAKVAFGVQEIMERIVLKRKQDRDEDPSP